jgi:hypothetical protein
MAYEQVRPQRAALVAEVDQLRRQVVETREKVILQEVGIYRYPAIPLEDGVAYRIRLSTLQAEMEDAVRAVSAVQDAANWSTAQPPREQDGMGVLELLLQAYKRLAEADSVVRYLQARQNSGPALMTAGSRGSSVCGGNDPPREGGCETIGSPNGGVATPCM